MNRTRLLLPLLGILVPILSACGPQSPQAAADEDQMVEFGMEQQDRNETEGRRR